jgi:hypothetical protein
MSNKDTIKIKPMLTLTYKNISENLTNLLISDYSDFIPTNFSGNGLIFTIDSLQDIPSKLDEPLNKKTSNELAEVIKLMDDNNCEFLMLREG